MTPLHSTIRNQEAFRRRSACGISCSSWQAVCLAGSVGIAQDPVKVSPKTYHVLVDNARVRVLHVAAAPGEKTALHQHPDNVTVLLTDGKITFTDAAGKSETMETKAGQALWSGPQTHAGANAGAAPLEAIVVELKGSAAPTAKLPSSRPNMTRTMLVENPRADAIRARPMRRSPKSPRRTHDYDQMVIAPGPATFSLEVGGKTKTGPGSGVTPCSSAAAKRIRRRTPAANQST